MTEPRIPMYIAVRLEHGYGGRARGTWLPLPATKKKFFDARERIGDYCGNILIPAYNVRVPGMYREMLLAAIIDSDRYFTGLEQFIDYTYTHDSYTLIPGVKNESELGRLYLDSPDFAKVPAALKKYIDPYALGKGVAEAQDGQFTALGYLASENGWNAVPKTRTTPLSLNLIGVMGEDLYGCGYTASGEPA